MLYACWNICIETGIRDSAQTHSLDKPFCFPVSLGAPPRPFGLLLHLLLLLLRRIRRMPIAPPARPTTTRRRRRWRWHSSRHGSGNEREGRGGGATSSCPPSKEVSTSRRQEQGKDRHDKQKHVCNNTDCIVHSGCAHACNNTYCTRVCCLSAYIHTAPCCLSPDVSPINAYVRVFSFSNQPGKRSAYECPCQNPTAAPPTQHQFTLSTSAHAQALASASGMPCSNFTMTASTISSNCSLVQPDRLPPI